MEGAGEVTAVGPDVTEFQVGDRVAYASPLGSYAEERLIPADRVVPLPTAIDDRTAAAMMLQGMTVRYLLRETYNVGPSTVMLLHAAAGGIGLIACQWAKRSARPSSARSARRRRRSSPARTAARTS